MSCRERARKLVIKALRKGPAGVAELAQAGVSELARPAAAEGGVGPERHIRNALGDLVRSGAVLRVERGRYALAEAPAAEAPAAERSVEARILETARRLRTRSSTVLASELGVSRGRVVRTMRAEMARLGLDHEAFRAWIEGGQR